LSCIPQIGHLIYENDDFGAELTGYFDDDINRLLTGLKTPYEKIDAIYNFVKTNLNGMIITAIPVMME
jgi:hypothetical protein